MSIAVQDHPAIGQTVVATTDAPLPDIEIRFTPVYAWMTIGFGVICFFLGLFIALLAHHGVGFGLSMCFISIAAAIGANYWRKHLHVVAQMTPRQLVLRKDGPVDWGNIAAIENKEIHAFNHGVRHRSEFVCIKLKSSPPPKNKWDGFFIKAKRAVIGYDIIVSVNDMACTADWFIDECRKRMAVALASSTVN